MAADRKPAKSRKRGRPRRFDERREELLQTAARVFCERGYQNATLEDIADAMGITRPALYHYGMSKEELYIEIGTIATGKLHAAIATAIEEKTGLDEVLTYFRRYMEIVHGYTTACFVLTDRRQLSAIEFKKDRIRQRDFLLSVQSMIERGIADGSIRACSPSAVARTLYAAFNGTLFTLRPGEEHNWREAADAILDIFLRGLRPTTAGTRKT